MSDNKKQSFRNRSQKAEWMKNVKIEHLLAGTVGGVTATLILHPLDLIKIRFQVSDGLSARPKYYGILDAFKSIKKSGGIRGLYQGVSPNVAGAGSAWGLYFFTYNFLKSSISDARGVKSLSAGEHLIAGTIAGTSTLCFTNPIWVVKTRMCLQFSADATTTNVNYRGVIDGLYKLWKYEGIRGCYKGFIPGLFGVSHGAIQFMAYEEFKKLNSKYTGREIDSRQVRREFLKVLAFYKSPELEFVANFEDSCFSCRGKD